MNYDHEKAIIVAGMLVRGHDFTLQSFWHEVNYIMDRLHPPTYKADETNTPAASSDNGTRYATKQEAIDSGVWKSNTRAAKIAHPNDDGSPFRPMDWAQGQLGIASNDEIPFDMLEELKKTIDKYPQFVRGKE